MKQLLTLVFLLVSLHQPTQAADLLRRVSVLEPTFTAGGATASVTIDAPAYTRTVTCSDYTLTGTASGPEAVTWSASPSGASGACTGTTSWSCVVDVAPDAVGEGVEVITVTQGTLTDTETIGFYVDGEHSCFLSQNVNGSYNVGLTDRDAVATWENLGSSALDATQGTAAAQPTFRTEFVNGQPIVRCDGGDVVTNSPASGWQFLHDGTDNTMDVVALDNATGGGQVYAGNTSASVTNGMWVASNGASLLNAMRDAAGAALFNFNVAGAPGHAAYRFEGLTSVLDEGGATEASFYKANTLIASQASVTGYSVTATNPFAICAAQSAYYTFGDVFRISIYQSAISSTQRGINKAVDEWALGGTFPVTPTTTRWLFVGDSLTAGSGGVTTWAKKMEGYTPSTVTFVNRAVAGHTASQILAQWTAGKVPTPDKVFILGGINDIAAGTSAATTFSSLEQIYSEAAALGVQVIAMPTLPAGNYALWSAPDQVQLELLEASIIADGNIDVLINFYDLMGEPGTPEDLAAAYDFGDGIHPNDAGTTVMAAAVAAALGL